MSVTVDSESLAAEELGLQTVGQVLSHLQRSRRLVIHLVIDGEEPDLARLSQVRQVPLAGHTVFLETADPRQLAGDVLMEIEHQLNEADQMRVAATDLLQQNQMAKALEKLSRCFTMWQHAQESLEKTASLLRIDLEKVLVADRPLSTMLTGFAGQLKQIRAALEQRDFVQLGDILLYEMAETTNRWLSSVAAVRAVIDGLR